MTVVINIGPRLDASQPHLVARDVVYRPTVQPAVTSNAQSRTDNGSGSSHRWGAPQSESGNETGGSDEGEGGKKKSEKSGKGKKDH